MMAISALPRLRGAPLVPFLFFYLLAALAYLIVLWVALKKKVPMWMIWGFAFLFRILLLNKPPTLSDDIFRYIWDGHLLTQGVNPYAFSVESPVLDVYSIPIRELVNHPWMASPYLPFAQALFGIISWLTPGSPIAFQIAAIIGDLLTGVVVAAMLKALQMPIQRVVLYLWNPLIILEFAHGAHIDVWMVLLVMVAFWLALRGRENQPHGDNPKLGWSLPLSAIALAAATLIKGLPLLLLPFFLLLWNWRTAVIFALFTITPVALFAKGAGWGLWGELDGSGVFGALRIYLRYWKFNASIYYALERLFSGYTSTGIVPFYPEYAEGINRARWVSSAAILVSSLVGGGLAWMHSRYKTGKAQVLELLRLSIIPLGVYLVFTTTLHPWYLTILVPFIPFLFPVQKEDQILQRFAWPWIYIILAVPLSYLTYINPISFEERSFVLWIEYLPFYILLFWASAPYLAGVGRWMSLRAMRLFLSKRK